MKTILITIAVIVLAALAGSQALIMLMQLAGMLTGNVL